jgi:hypothetical protein
MEHRSEIFNRFPPGDRWISVNDSPEAPTRVFPSLTEALEYYFQNNKVRTYFINAAEGKIYSVEELMEAPYTPPQYSIYGDE